MIKRQESDKIRFWNFSRRKYTAEIIAKFIEFIFSSWFIAVVLAKFTKKYYVNIFDFIMPGLLILLFYFIGVTIMPKE
jgi:energy-coupling factor transporter transmembrane protein EcfT